MSSATGYGIPVEEDLNPADKVPWWVEGFGESPPKHRSLHYTTYKKGQKCLIPLLVGKIWGIRRRLSTTSSAKVRTLLAHALVRRVQPFLAKLLLPLPNQDNLLWLISLV
jgi:hypothetical protein